MSRHRAGKERENWPRKLHRLADGVDRRFGSVLRAIGPVESAWTAILDGIVARQSDRRYMRKTILPALARMRPARILFVGVRGYTQSYGKAFQGRPTEYWTSDIDPAAAIYGAPSRHVTEDVRELDAAFRPGFFEVIVLNGVFGWGVDQPEDMNRTLASLATVLAPGGVLLIGWNSDRVPDPRDLPGIAAFQAAEFAGLPGRKTFADVTHVYSWFRKPG